MPLNLTSPSIISDTVSALKINSFAVDLDNKEIFIAYSELNSSDQVIAEKSISIVEPDFTNSIINANTLANADVYAALKQSLYDEISAQTGTVGEVA